MVPNRLLNEAVQVVEHDTFLLPKLTQFLTKPVHGSALVASDASRTLDA